MRGFDGFSVTRLGAGGDPSVARALVAAEGPVVGGELRIPRHSAVSVAKGRGGSFEHGEAVIDRIEELAPSDAAFREMVEAPPGRTVGTMTDRLADLQAEICDKP